MANSPPCVRRLCVCVGGATHQGILDSACDSLAVAILYREYFPGDGLDLGFASPGVDEPALVSDLIDALRDAAVRTRGYMGKGGDYRCPAAATPVLAAFHVGITRVQSNEIGGTAVAHVRGLLQTLTSSDPVSQADGMLVVGVSATLFDDIGVERNFGQGWMPLVGGDSSRIDAWWRVY